MNYLFIYILIGLLLVLWDFRKYFSVIFWYIRSYKAKNDVAKTLVFGPKPQLYVYNMPTYVREKNYLIAIMFIIFWPVKVIFNPKIVSYIRNIRSGRVSFFSQKNKNNKIKQEIIDKVTTKDGSILFFPILEVLNDENPENKLEFIKEIMRMDKTRVYTEEEIETQAHSILNIHLGIEPIPTSSLPFHK